MSEASWALVVLFLAVAAVDWWAVSHRKKTLEYVAKPAAMAVLIALALSLDASEVMTAWILVALVFSLSGDVFLMLPQDRFIFGLASFFVAHVAYIVAFTVAVEATTSLVIPLVPVVVIAGLIGSRLVTGPRMSSEMRIPVIAYIAVIAFMAAGAIATGSWSAAVGAGLFMASDSAIGWRRFVAEMGWMPLMIIVTYHLGQLLLVLSLVDIG